ncbi:MAG: beta-ketoacyl-[acyl-carrier-protein] synthase family protein [Candidatus Omnitrophota bacterium]
MMNRRVVVTGVGVITSIGTGREVFWNNLIAGKNGISPVTTFNTDEYEFHNGGEVKDFAPEKYMPAVFIKDAARASRFAVASAVMAVADSGIKTGGSRIGAIVGTTMADIQSLEQINKYWVRQGEESVWAANVVKYPGNKLSNQIGYCLGLRGLNSVIPTACSAGNYSIGYSYDLIRKGQYDIMLTGGSDPMSRITFTGFSRLFAMAPEKCQPFDKNRKGMMVGEGAGMLVLEELGSAKKRGAEIYAEIAGYGLSCDARHMTAPDVNGIEKVMRKALKNSGINEGEVDYISAHGTGTPANDKAETEAIKRVFGGYSKKLAVSSIKSMLGHTMGAASAIEAVSCCLAVKNGVIPPTINYETVDPECDLDCVANEARSKNMNVVLNNSLAFGGNNACLAFKKYTGV